MAADFPLCLPLLASRFRGLSTANIKTIPLCVLHVSVVNKFSSNRNHTMIERRIHLLIIGMSAMLFWNCAKDRAAVQLAKYVNQGILNIAELEQKPLERYASVTGKNYTTDQAVSEALRDFIIPYYGMYLKELRLIRPEIDELKRIHKIYLQGAELLYRGFKMKLAGIEAQDPDIIRSANKQIEMGSMKSEEWRNELISLYTKYGIAEKGRRKRSNPG